MANSIAQYAIDFIYAKLNGGKVFFGSIARYVTRYEYSDLADDDLVTKHILTNAASALNPPVILLFAATSPNPIIIDNWQATYAPNLGNRPSIVIMKKVPDDGDGNPAESDRSDLRPIRYYSDPPANTLLTKISIETTEGATLLTDYTIKLTK